MIRNGTSANPNDDQMDFMGTARSVANSLIHPRLELKSTPAIAG
jgi:hypothetical protein